MIIPKTGIPFYSISAGKFRRYSGGFWDLLNPVTIFKNLVDFGRVIKGFFESLKLIKKIKPDAIFLKGGFVSVPLGLAAKVLNYPFILHESDSAPGLANRILAKFARKICVSFKDDYFQQNYPNKVVYTGNPVRKELVEGDRERGYKEFNLKDNLLIILVIGGSQGSLKINRLIEEILEDILYKYQLIHITGERDYDWIDFRAKRLPEELRGNYRYYNFISKELKDAYKISDLIISRAGNNVLTEIAANGKPSLLIPLLSSTSGHQQKNALLFSRNGAAYILDESIVTASELLRQINFVLESKEEREIMSKKASEFFVAGASEAITSEILRLKKKAFKNEGQKAKAD